MFHSQTPHLSGAVDTPKAIRGLDFSPLRRCKACNSCPGFPGTPTRFRHLIRFETTGSFRVHTRVSTSYFSVLFTLQSMLFPHFRNPGSGKQHKDFRMSNAMIGNHIQETIDRNELYLAPLLVVITQIRKMFIAMQQVIRLVFVATLFTMRKVIGVVIGARFSSNHDSTPS